MAIIKTVDPNTGSSVQRSTGLDALSGLGSLGSLASTAIGAVTSIGQTRRQKKLMDYQSELNQKMFNLQQDAQNRMYERQLADQRKLIQEEREYNDYASVKARAQKAGVNPLYALGASGGIGIQSSSGSAPSLGSATANGVSIASPDSIGANLISAGSTLAQISRQNALLDAEKRSAEALALKNEIEANWTERKLDIDYRDKESNIVLRDAQIGTEKQRERLVTLQGNMQEILNSQQGPLGDAKLRKLSEEIRLFGLEAQGLEIKNSKQAEILDSQIAESQARVFATYESVRQKYIELEQNAEKLNLSKSELDEVKRANKELESFRRDKQAFDEKMDKKRFTKEVVLGTIDSATRVAGAVASFINPLKNIASSRPALADSWSDSGYLFAD